MSKERILTQEADWLEEALTNSLDKGFIPGSYRDGFAAAIGWLRLHARMAGEGL